MLNPMDMSGRTVLVTGASSGIGRETAILLSRLGARIVLVARDQGRLEETASQLAPSTAGAAHCVEPFDLNSTDEISKWLKRIAGETGVLHGFVHSAGMQVTKPVRFLDLATIEATFHINFLAGFALAKAFMQKGVRSDGASLVFLSSVMGSVGQPGISAYAASKGALNALVKSLAMEFARERVRVNCVAPAHVRTEMAEQVEAALTQNQFEAIEAMHPLGIGSPTDVAHAIAFLLADTGRWITGTTLFVDGGYTAH